MMKKVCISGTVALDIRKYVKAYPRKSQLAIVEKEEPHSGGIISNTGISFARLNPEMEVQLYTDLGTDEFADTLLQEYAKYSNLNTSHIRRRGHTPVTDAICDLSDGTRTFFYYPGNSKDLDLDLFEGDLDFELIHIGYLMMLGKLDHPDPDYGTRMASLLARFQSQGIQTSIDLVSEDRPDYKDHVLPALRFTDYCIINELEGAMISSIPSYKQGELDLESMKKTAKFIKDQGVKRWVVLHSPKVSVGYDGEKIEVVYSDPISPEDIVQSVGAGDAFAAGVLTGVARGLNLVESIETGNLAAAMLLVNEEGKHAISTFEELKEERRS